jgi:hypothetical protein
MNVQSPATQRQLLYVARFNNDENFDKVCVFDGRSEARSGNTVSDNRLARVWFGPLTFSDGKTSGAAMLAHYYYYYIIFETNLTLVAAGVGEFVIRF